MGLSVWFMLYGITMDFGLALAHFLPLGGGLWMNSRILEQRPAALTTTVLFWAACAALPLMVDGWALPRAGSIAVCLGMALLYASTRLSAGPHENRQADRGKVGRMIGQ